MPDDFPREPAFHWPNDEEKLVIVGRNGTGKTQAGINQLSTRSFDLMPWVIVDTKRDQLLNRIEGLQDLTFGKLPSEPGLYIIRTGPRDKEQIDDLMLQIWENENIGVYIDEGYSIPQSDNFDALLTQGRSKRIPMIILSQRPNWMSRFVWSETGYFQVFWLTDADDRKTVKRYVPQNVVDIDERLPPYHSHWYDVAQNKAWTLKPVPGEGAILATFARRLAPKPDEPLPIEAVDARRQYRVI